MERIKLSQYAENLSVEAKDRYKSKLSDCQVDPYIDGDFEHLKILPGVTYEQILVNRSHCSNSKQNAFKSLDAYRTVCAEGWLSSLEVREWKRGITSSYGSFPFFSSSFVLEIYENYTNNVSVHFYSQKPHNIAAFYLPQACPIPL